MVKIGILDDNNAEFLRTYECVKNYGKGKDICVQRVEPGNLQLAIEESGFDLHILITEAAAKKTDVLQLVKDINRNFIHCQIIYLTDRMEYVSKVYETEHCYFVKKTELELVLPKALNKAMHRVEETKYQYLKVICERKPVELPMNQIICIERAQSQCRIITNRGDYLCYHSLKQLMDRMPDDFIRCHTGYVVNVNYAVDISRTHISMNVNGRSGESKKIPIGRSFLSEVREAYEKRAKKVTRVKKVQKNIKI